MARKAATAGKPLVYVIAGKDKFLASLEVQKVLDEVIPVEQRQMGLLTPDADKVSASEVLDELRTPGFLAESKVVLLKGADDFISEHRTSLERYFDAPSSSGVLIMSVSSWPGNTRLAKKLPEVGMLVNVVEMKTYQLPDFVVRYAKDRHGKAMNRQAAGMLVELVGDDAGRLAGEVDKLAMFAEGKGSIGAADVEAAVGRNRFFDAFEVISSMTRGQTGPAVGRLRNMFRTNKDAGYTVVGAFAYHFRRMFTAKAMLMKGANPSEVASKVRVWHDKEGFFEQVQRLSIEQLGAIIRGLARIDHATKTGQGTADVMVEQLVISVGQMSGSAKKSR